MKTTDKQPDSARTYRIKCDWETFLVSRWKNVEDWIHQLMDKAAIGDLNMYLSAVSFTVCNVFLAHLWSNKSILIFLLFFWILSFTGWPKWVWSLCPKSKKDINESRNVLESIMELAVNRSEAQNTNWCIKIITYQSRGTFSLFIICHCKM